MSDDVDRQLGALAAAARASVRVSSGETEQALADVTGGANVTRLRPVEPASGRGLRLWVAVAAATALVATGGIWLLTRGPEKITTTTPTVPSPTAAEVVTVPSTPPSETLTTSPPSAVAVPSIGAPASTQAPATSEVPDTTAASTTTVPTVDLATMLAGLAWESSGIERSCTPVTGACTRVMFDPAGVPVSFDPNTRTLRRHMRLGAQVDDVTLPAEFGDAWLLAAGPGEVVYLGVPTADPEASDVVAVSFAADDAGREVARFPGALGLGDYDVIHAPEGLASVGWYGQGAQPSEPFNILATWVARDGSRIRNPHALVQVDFYEHTVDIAGRRWQVDDLPFDTHPSWSPIMQTFDGGFIAHYSAFDGARSVVVRGWPDGTVERWEVPAGLSVDLEPTGLVLVPDAEWFARVQPFSHTTAWDGRVEPDFARFTATAPGLDEFLDANDPYWETDPIAFVAALRRFDVASFHSIEVTESTADHVIVVDTTERLLDDSGFGSRRVFTLRPTEAGLRVESIALTQTCQPGRGHQDYQAAFCT